MTLIKNILSLTLRILKMKLIKGTKTIKFLILAILVYFLYSIINKQAETTSSLSANIPINRNLGGGFNLLSTTGQHLNLNDLRGKVVLLTFGYADCNEICPIGLMKLHEVINKLGGDTKDLYVIFISFDSENKIEKLTKYINHYDNSIIGLTGSEQEIIDLTNRYGVIYPKKQKKSGKQKFDHNGFIYLLDQNGRIRNLYQNNTSVKDIVKDVHTLLKKSITYSLGY